MKENTRNYSDFELEYSNDDLLWPRQKPLKGTLVGVRTEPKIGRNESCKCGSGKKFKKCCNNKKD